MTTAATQRRTKRDATAPKTLLAELISARNLSQEEVIDVLRERAHQLNIRAGSFDISLRQLQRWVAGEVSHPRPVQRRVLEAEFARPFTELLAAPVNQHSATRGFASAMRVGSRALRPQYRGSRTEPGS